MPPKPQWNRDAATAPNESEQLPGGRRQRGGAGPHAEGQSFAGGDGRAQRATAQQKKKKSPGGAARWSYVLQDFPDMVSTAMHDVNKGYIIRLGAVTVGAALAGYAVYMSLVSRQERKPLAKRWTWFSPPVPITLLEKNREEQSNVYTYRFALPNSYDYAGYDPVSSVRIISGNVRELSSLARWYTPISHPDERGFIEFAIKDCDPGRMSARLRYLEVGDVVHLGRWMKEFDYGKMKKRAAKAGVDHAELGLICTTGGASIALQLMTILDKDPSDNTALSVLYCHHNAQHIPFRDSRFDAFQARHPNRITVKYNVLSLGTPSRDPRRAAATTASTEATSSGSSHFTPATPLAPWIHVGENVFMGNLDPDTIRASMPPPVRLVTDSAATSSGLEGTAATAGSNSGNSSNSFLRGSTLYRPHILVCGPQSLLNYVSGRVSPFSNYTYWQGPFFRYNGFLKDMGYERKQVYKFGVSTHFLAMH